jgi:hypothetical protein
LQMSLGGSVSDGLCVREGLGYGVAYLPVKAILTVLFGWLVRMVC